MILNDPECISLPVLVSFTMDIVVYAFYCFSKSYDLQYMFTDAVHDTCAPVTTTVAFEKGFPMVHQ